MPPLPRTMPPATRMLSRRVPPPHSSPTSSFQSADVQVVHALIARGAGSRVGESSIAGRELREPAPGWEGRGAPRAGESVMFTSSM